MRLFWLLPIIFALDSTNGLTPIGVVARAVTYQGRHAVRLSGQDGGVALIDGLDFTSGTIVLQVAAVDVPSEDSTSRGFVGITFHSDARSERYENIYLRMTNGRAEDQLRRNHAAQYESMPDAPWYTLRSQHPGQYEAYVDLERGAWTTMRLVVDGTRARLYVNNATQPCLIVNDLKLGASGGRVGLFIGPGTVGYFSRLEVTPAP
jgi:hypothetical protein